MGAGSMRQGMLEAINTGYIEQEIARASYRYQRQLEEGSRSIIGVNAYQSQPGSGENALEVFEFDEAEEGAPVGTAGIGPLFPKQDRCGQRSSSLEPRGQKR